MPRKRTVGRPSLVHRRPSGDLHNGHGEHAARRSVADEVANAATQECSPVRTRRRHAIREGVKPSGLRTALNRALRWGLVRRNVADLVDGPKVERHKIEPSSPVDARAFLDPRTRRPPGGAVFRGADDGSASG
jgi:hypothetical protein